MGLLCFAIGVGHYFLSAFFATQMGKQDGVGGGGGGGGWVGDSPCDLMLQRHDVIDKPPFCSDPKDFGRLKNPKKPMFIILHTCLNQDIKPDHESDQMFIPLKLIPVSVSLL